MTGLLPVWDTTDTRVCLPGLICWAYSPHGAAGSGGCSRQEGVSEPPQSGPCAPAPPRHPGQCNST